MASSRAVVSVVGRDQVGIIARVATVLAENGVNILDISQTTMQEFFTMIMLVDLRGSEDSVDGLRQRLAVVEEAMGLRINVQHEDVFLYMHRV